MDNISLYTHINSLPPNLKQEVRDFVEFLKQKADKAEKANSRNPQRLYGVLKGKIEISEDFDDPIDDFKDYM